MSKANGQFKTFNPIIKCIKRLLRVLVLTCIYWHVWKLFGLVLQAVKSASWIKREVLCYLIITPCKFATPTWDSSSAIIKMNLFNRECHRLITLFQSGPRVQPWPNNPFLRLILILFPSIRRSLEWTFLSVL